MGNLRITDHLEDRNIDGRILNLVFKKWDREHGLDLSGSGERQVVGSCECSNEPSCSVTRGKILD